ncbi:MAG: ferritin [bacterium]
MLSKKMLKALNDQMTYELNSSYIYLGMDSYFTEQNLNGMASWMSKQAQEEWGHGMKFKGYIENRLAQAEFGALDKPAVKYDSPLAAFKAALKHEKTVTKRIHDLVDLAQAEKDHATASFLQWYVDEQVEEESSVDHVIQRLEQIGDFRPGLFFLDGELANRAG